MDDHGSGASCGPAMRDLVGTRVDGRYTLEEYVGEGGFGATYRSSVRRPDGRRAEVAVKLTKLIEVAPEVVGELLSEAQLVADAFDDLEHDDARVHLVPVLDRGVAPSHENRVFVVSEFVPGTDLTFQLGFYRNGVPPNLLLSWMRQVVRGMSALHGLVPPLLHRDLKPDNIRLGVDNRIRLLDFGLAARLLPYGYVPGQAGTKVYMAPETMAQGMSVAASDVYSIGVILYQGLTGRHPFGHLVPPASLPLSLHADWLCGQKSRLRIEPPSFANRAIPRQFHWLDEVVLKCLSYHPAPDRYFDATDLTRALNPPSPGPLIEAEVIRRARELRAQGQWDLARQRYEAALESPALPRQTRFELLRELGGLLLVSGGFHDAQRHLEVAWQMADKTALLRTRQERARLLDQLARAASGCKNEYLAAQYQSMSQREAHGQRG